jgi:hypothetical protein
MSKVVVKRDTQGWFVQTYTSFGLAFLLSSIAVWNLNGEGLERALVAVCLFFLLFSTFTLSKTLRDNQYEQVDTNAWKMMVWIGFSISLALSSWGIYRMQINEWQKGFIISSGLFLLSSAFTLSKTIRDKADADMIESKAE